MGEASYIKEILAKSHLFHGLPDRDLEKLAAISRREVHETGDIILVEGAPAAYLYVIEEGRVSLEMKISIGSKVSRQSTIDVIGAGAACGWSAAFGMHPLTMTVRCLEPTRVVAVEGAPLRRLLVEDPPVGALVVGRLVNIVFSRLQNTRKTLANTLSVVAHDLKSPLAAVQSYNQVMLAGMAGDLTEKQRFMLQRNSERIKGFLNLIDDLLDISSVEAALLDMKSVSLPDVVCDAVENMHPLAEEKGIRLTVESPPALSQVQGSVPRLQQVVNNLVENAIKYTPAGGFILVRLSEDNGNVKLEVCDTGIGILAEDLPHIFDDFYRSAASGSKGAGLGLSIARKVVVAHKGRIWAESPCPETGKGSKFIVVLPKIFQKG